MGNKIDEKSNNIRFWRLRPIEPGPPQHTSSDPALLSTIPFQCEQFKEGAYYFASRPRKSVGSLTSVHAFSPSSTSLSRESVVRTSNIELWINFYALTQMRKANESMTLNIKLKRATPQRTGKKRARCEAKSIDKSTSARTQSGLWLSSCTVDFDWYVRFSFAKILTRSRNGNEARSTTLGPSHYSHEMIGLLFWWTMRISHKHHTEAWADWISRAMRNANTIFLELILKTNSRAAGNSDGKIMITINK